MFWSAISGAKQPSSLSSMSRSCCSDIWFTDSYTRTFISTQDYGSFKNCSRKTQVLKKDVRIAERQCRFDHEWRGLLHLSVKVNHKNFQYWSSVHVHRTFHFSWSYLKVQVYAKKSHTFQALSETIRQKLQFERIMDNFAYRLQCLKKIDDNQVIFRNWLFFV